MNQTTKEPFDQFASVIRDLTKLADDIARVENAKAGAASEKHHYRIDGFIQEEQAYLLKLRGLEQRRIRLAKELGWDTLTFRQILEKAPKQQSELLSPLFYELEQKLKKLEQARKSSEQIIQVRVHELETFIAMQEGIPYDSSGNVNLNTSAHAKLRDTYV